MKPYRYLIIITMLLIAVCIGLGSYVSTMSARVETPHEEESLGDSFDAVEEDATFMDISNQDELYSLLPDMAADIINQVYAQHYEKSKIIDRFGTIEGGISQKNYTYSFTVHFTESDIRRPVTVTIINEATKRFDVSVGDPK